MKKNRIGIDIGGTSIKAGVIAPDGQIVAHREMATPLNPHQGMDQIKGLIGEWLSNSETTIGVAAPGPMDLQNGLFLDPPNLKGWHNYPFVKQFEKNVGKTCLFENDANAAAVGEYYAGAGNKAKSMVYITISTGIGAGIVLNGQILTGAQFSAGEVGNMIITNEGPKREGLNVGSWESLASGTAIKEKVEDVFQSKDGAKELLKRVKNNEKLAVEMFNEWMEHLASGIANIVHVINPEMIVLGGGVMIGKDVILPSLIPAVKEKVYASLRASIDIQPAKLGTKAGVIGASYLPIVKRL
ncbi:ROK family protein [Salipaludibacillus daqingensis]|uniref:ROK family protein n=1 Tax=Salipaludibacillus daqingensis TaxID=3041001 RepID=UPI0024746A83|nr:ROK family protein [Salipaludibacillus daqingensis]